MLKLNAPAEIHWRRSNVNKQDPILMKSVEVLKDCRSLNAADEMNCSMLHSVKKVPVRNEKRCIKRPCHLFKCSQLSVNHSNAILTCSAPLVTLTRRLPNQPLFPSPAHRFLKSELSVPS